MLQGGRGPWPRGQASAAAVLLGCTLTTLPTAALRPQSAEELAFELSVCECDLLAGLCDLNCCCDPDCGCADIPSFTVDCSCTSVGTSDFRFRCGASRVSSAHSGPFDDLHPLLCIEREGHQPYKGLVFPVVNLSRSGTSVPAALAADNRVRFTYAVGGALTTAESAALAAAEANYRDGSPLLTFANSSISLQSAGFLSHPTELLGRCTDFTAARFRVQEASGECVRSPAAAVAGCVTGGALDLHAYAATAVGTYLLQRGGTTANRLAIDNVTVVVVSGGSTTTLSRGLTDPPLDLTTFAAAHSGSTCTNTVTTVNRTFVWAGDTVVQLVTFVVLEAVSTASPVVQRFASDFRSTSVDTAALPLQFGRSERSGNPGYLVGRPLLGTLSSGYAGPFGQTFGTPGGANTTATLATIAPGAGSGCAAATVTEVQFGVDQVAGCTLSVASTDSCAAIRAAAAAAIDVGINRLLCVREYGTGVSSDCAAVLPEETVQNVTENETAHDAGMAQLFPEYYCPGVLTEVGLELLVAPQGGVQSFAQKRVLSARLTRVYSAVVVGCGGHTGNPPTANAALGNGCVNPSIGASTIDLYQSVKFLTLPRAAFRFRGDLPPPAYTEQHSKGCRDTTCYDQVFYPFLTRWNATASLDLEYQQAKAYGVIMAGAAAIGVVVWVSVWSNFDSSLR